MFRRQKIYQQILFKLCLQVSILRGATPHLCMVILITILNTYDIY